MERTTEAISAQHRVGGRVEAVGRHGTALGLFAEPELHEVDVDLGPGDVLCLFTDGLVEARNGSHQFGADRAADVVRLHRGEPPAAVAGALELAAREFSGRDLGDDLAIVVLQVPVSPDGLLGGGGGAAGTTLDAAVA